MRERASAASPARLAVARGLALLLPAALLAGAFGAQYWGGLAPCEMCWWQRWPHIAAVVLALIGHARPRAAWPVALAALAIAASGAIGVFHAGVEYRWWEGITACTAAPTGAGSVEDALAGIMATPLVRCDVAPWTFAGVSLAGFNAILSLGGALVILWTMRRLPR